MERQKAGDGMGIRDGGTGREEPGTGGASFKK